MQLFETADDVVDPLDINIIYCGTTQDSPARKLMVDFYSLYAGPDSFGSSWIHVHPDFTLSLLKAFSTTQLIPQGYRVPWVHNPKSYYVKKGKVAGACFF